MTMAARTLMVVNDLLLGRVLDRQLISQRLGVESKAAGRYLSAVSKMLGARVRRAGKKKFVYWGPDQWAEDRSVRSRKKAQR